MNEKEIINRMKLDDRQAFARLYDAYWSTVYRFATIFLKRKSLAEDVVQEVFLKIWDAREKINPEAPLSNLLFIITRNIIFNVHRKQVNAQAYKEAILRCSNAEYSIDESQYAKELLDLIEMLTQELPEKRRQVFILSRKQHCSNADIAQQLGISEKTVENHIYESLRYLKKNLSFFSLFL